MKFQGDRIQSFNLTPFKLLTFLSFSIILASCQASLKDSQGNGKVSSQPESQSPPTVNPDEAEVELYVRALSIGQQAYFLVNTKFSSTIEEMGIGSVPRTENYDLKISRVEKTQSQITATAKKSGLKSYAASVFVIDENKGTTVAVICSTDNPSQIPPEIPQSTPKSFSDKPHCPAGTKEVVAKPNL